MKTCNHCKTPKTEAEFSKSKRYKDGLAKRCKKCHYEMNKSKTILDNRKLYRVKNSEKITSRVTEWARNNPESRKKISNRYFYVHKELILNTQKELVKSISDKYAKALLVCQGWPKEIAKDPELIDLKRKEVQLKRILKGVIQ